MTKQTIDIKDDNSNNITALRANGSCTSTTDAVNKILEAMFTNNYRITLNGVEKNIYDFMVNVPYVREDFTNLGASGKYEKKFITNFNKISSDLLKRAIFNFMKASFEFINRKYSKRYSMNYGKYASIGSLENISCYYPSEIAGTKWHAFYIDVKYSKNDRVSISRFMQLKFKNTYVNNDNFLWDEVKAFFSEPSQATKDTYSLDVEELEALTAHINNVF
ncbi:hypothetical protein [Clostridium estertheticum]|uniref:Uncharacterized protein n=1 Tax=Clostridium estertheticum TaxID=238834 RepID=A0A7Y3T048_9CLOT|nr:hypothetical protein [Clostridium estertheticum]NNU78593.1 hypothetical protein [Clostridium estertheticum]WBL49683.1 hypothetical protein LOR37_23280 [Clostridium estertheticum]